MPHQLKFLYVAGVFILTLFTTAANAQTDSAAPTPPSPNVKVEKPDNFKSVNLGYIFIGQPDKRAGLSFDLEIMSYVPTQRMRVGIEYHGMYSTMVFYDYAWYTRSPIIRRLFNGYFEIGLGVGAFGYTLYSEQRPAVELRSGYGYRMRLSDRVNMKLALRGRLGYRKTYDFTDYGLYPEIGLELSFGYDLF